MKNKLVPRTFHLRPYHTEVLDALVKEMKDELKATRANAGKSELVRRALDEYFQRKERLLACVDTNVHIGA
jgi:hypothetical protein